MTRGLSGSRSATGGSRPAATCRAHCGASWKFRSLSGGHSLTACNALAWVGCRSGICTESRDLRSTEPAPDNAHVIDAKTSTQTARAASTMNIFAAGPRAARFRTVEILSASIA